MKAIGVCGSTRLQGNTEYLLNVALQVCRDQGIETELITLADKQVEDCQNCRHCRQVPGECAQKDDVPPIYAALKGSNAFILASPVYYASISGKMKCFIDRIGWLSSGEGRVFERKVGGGLVVARRAGFIFALHELHSFFLQQGMIVPGSTYWNLAIGREPGEVARDEEGIRTAQNFAANLAWLVEKLSKG